MTQITLNTLEQRLDRLEREVRWWKVFGAITAVGLALFILLGATTVTLNNEVRAKRFVLVDDNGVTRALLEVKGRVTSFEMLSESTPRIAMSVSDIGGSYLTVKGRGQHNSVGIYTMTDSPLVDLQTSTKADVVLQVPRDTPDPKLGITLMRTLASLSLADGKPTLSLYDTAGTPRTVIGDTTLQVPAVGTTEVRPTSSVVLVNKEGKVIWKAP